MHLHDTVEELQLFNVRRKLKGAVLAAVSSSRWLTLDDLDDQEYEDDEEEDGPDAVSKRGAHLFQAALPSSLEEEEAACSSAVSQVLDSLEDIGCLLDAATVDPDILYSVLQDVQLHALLEVSYPYQIIDRFFFSLFLHTVKPQYTSNVCLGTRFVNVTLK